MTGPAPCPGCGRPIISGPSLAGVVIRLDATPGTGAAYHLEVVDGRLVEARSNDEVKKAKGKNFYRAHVCTVGR